MTTIQRQLSQLKPSLLLDKRIELGLVFSLFALVHILSLLRGGESLETGYVLLIFYGSAGYFYYQKNNQLKFSNHFFSQSLGGILTSYLAIRILLLQQSEIKIFWAITAPLMIVGLILLADGFRGIRQFWRLLLGITFITLISKSIEKIIFSSSYLNEVSAKASAYILWYLGFNPQAQSTFLYVNGGVVNINSSCTALPIFLVYLNLLLILWLFYPRLIKNFPCYLLLTFIISFFLSLVRIAVMALVVNNKPLFDYWHGYQGSNIFMIVGLLCFGGLIFFNVPNSPQISRSNSLKNNFSPSKPVWRVIIPTIFLLFIFSKVIISPQGAANQLVTYQFPTQINISGWEFLESQPLQIPAIAPEETENQAASNRILSSKRYFYKQENFTLISTLKYIIIANSNLSDYLQNQVSELTTKNSLDNVLKQSLEQDQFLLFSDQSAAFLTACVTPQGHSIISTPQFIKARNQGVLSTFTNPSDFWQWLKGDRLLRDQRCLWIELELKPNASQANQKLESAWQDLWNFWQANFPSIHG